MKEIKLDVYLLKPPAPNFVIPLSRFYEDPLAVSQHS